MSISQPSCTLTLTLAALLASGCELDEPDEASLGELVSSGSRGGLYRLDRRVGLVLWHQAPEGERPRFAACGHLTERAVVDIDRIVGTLDPEGEYGVDARACRDRYGEDVTSSKLHIEGFSHAPFVCASECCAEGLQELFGIYNWAWAGLEGQAAELQALGLEPYDALEPERPCRSGE